MKAHLLSWCALAALLPSPAVAQASGDDVRCVLLGAGFSRLGKDDSTRQAASLATSFYIGRVTARLSGPALSAAIRAQGKGMPAKEAAAAMRTCVERAKTAQNELFAAAQAAQTGR